MPCTSRLALELPPLGLAVKYRHGACSGTGGRLAAQVLVGVSCRVAQRCPADSPLISPRGHCKPLLTLHRYLRAQLPEDPSLRATPDRLWRGCTSRLPPALRHRCLPGQTRSGQRPAASRHLHKTVWDRPKLRGQRHEAWRLSSGCRATRDEAPAELDTGASAPTAAASASGEFGRNGAASSAEDLIGEDGVKVEALAKGWGALPARYQMVVTASERPAPFHRLCLAETGPSVHFRTFCAHRHQLSQRPPLDIREI